MGGGQGPGIIPSPVPAAKWELGRGENTQTINSLQARQVWLTHGCRNTWSPELFGVGLAGKDLGIGVIIASTASVPCGRGLGGEESRIREAGEGRPPL